MTSPIEHVTVECPKCRHRYETQFRASMNLDLDNFSDEYVESMSTATCPKCEHKAPIGAIIVRGDEWTV